MRAILPAVFALLPSAASAEEFVAHSAGGPVTGVLERIDADGSVVIGGKTVAGLVALQRVGKPTPPPPAEPHLVTSVGDRIPGSLLGCEETGVRYRAKMGGGADLRVPLSYAGVLWLVRADSRLGRDPQWREILSSPRKRDVLWLKNRDALVGTLVKLDPRDGKGNLEVGEPPKPTEIDLSRVAAVGFNTALARTRKPTKPYAAVTLADGTRIQFAKWSADGQFWTGETLFGEQVRIPLDDVIQVRVLNGRAVHLSDLKPSRYDETPYLGPRWEWSADSAWGEPIALDTPDGVATFDKGISMHSASAITFALGGRYTRFEAVVGVQHGRSGEAEVAVKLDGQVVDLDGGADVGPGRSRAISVDVAGKKELTLAVTFGRGGAVQDEIVWGNARLIRKE